MGTSVTIRNVPEATHAELVERAALHGQSLQEYLLAQIVALAARPDMKVLMARVHAWKEKAETDVPVETILADLRAERE